MKNVIQFTENISNTNITADKNLHQQQIEQLIESCEVFHSKLNKLYYGSHTNI